MRLRVKGVQGGRLEVFKRLHWDFHMMGCCQGRHATEDVTCGV